jgi:hypothetical protein
MLLLSQQKIIICIFDCINVCWLGVFWEWKLGQLLCSTCNHLVGICHLNIYANMFQINNGTLSICLCVAGTQFDTDLWQNNSNERYTEHSKGQRLQGSCRVLFRRLVLIEDRSEFTSPLTVIK